MRKVLLFAPYFVPRRRVGALRPFKFAVHLKNMGWKVSVMTIASPGRKLSKREKSLLKGVNIIPINTPFDRTSGTEKRKTEKRQGSSLLQNAGSFIDKHTPLDTWIYLMIARYFSIQHNAKKIRPDVVWATGDPWSGLWMGNKISKNLGVPFVADFRDPWTLSNLALRERSDISNHIDKQAEKKIIDEADKLIFTSAAAQRMYVNHYNLDDSKTATIYNSFEPSLSTQNDDISWNYSVDTSALNILFFGEFRRLSPVDSILELLKVIKNESPNTGSKIMIHSFGQSDDKNRNRIKDAGLSKQFIFHEPVLPEAATSVLNSADVLLLSTQQDRSHIVPAKLWDYLSVDKPILSLTPNQEIEEIIEKSGAGIHFYPAQKDEAVMFLKEAAEGKLKGDLLLTGHAGDINKKPFSAESTARELSKILEDLVNHG